MDVEKQNEVSKKRWKIIPMAVHLMNSEVTFFL